MNPSGALAAEDRVTRFIHHPRDLGPNQSPKPAVFEPGPDGAVSVAQITDLDETAIWRLARHTLNIAAGRKRVVGRADLQVAAIASQGLACIRNDIGFQHHSEIVGWPNDSDLDSRKRKRREIARRLCEAASGVAARPQIE
ncbi:MAG: hypothetical protein ACRD04_08910 [Terriglobales bacterium]